MERKRRGCLPHLILKSKYEKYGDEVIKYLKEYRTDNEERLGIYEHQREAVFRTQTLFEKQRRNGLDVPVLIVAPVGSGKTGMIVLLPYVLKSKKVLIVAPSKATMEKLGVAFGQRSFSECFFKVANLTDDEDSAKEYLEQVHVVRNAEDMKSINLPNLVILTTQTCEGRSWISLDYDNQVVINNVRSAYDKFDTLIIDEAHQFSAEDWKGLVKDFNGINKKVIFISSTPYIYVDGEQVNILPKEQVAFTVTPEMIREATAQVTEVREHQNNREDILLIDIS